MTRLLFAAICITVLFLTSCRHEPKPEKSKSDETFRWKRFTVPPGADPSVSAEDGGAGFENIAAKAGWKTNSVKPGEEKFFGDASAQTGGNIHVLGAFAVNLRPLGYGVNTINGGLLSQLCYETLLGAHPFTNEYMPALASHWKISDDGMTYWYRINPNARFSNGKPVTAEDVAATYRLLTDEMLLSPLMLATYAEFEKPVVRSKYIVEVRSKKKGWQMFDNFSGMLILSADEIGKLTGEEFNENYDTIAPVGSGEYIVLSEDVRTGKMIAYTRRGDYWRKDYPEMKYAGNFDRIVVESLGGSALIAYEKFKKGDYDITLFTSSSTDLWVRDTNYEALQKNWILKKRIYTQGFIGNQAYAFNMRKPPFDDIRVRRAFCYLLDRETIISKLLSNEYTPINGFYFNAPYSNPTNERIEYNPELASALLAEAGWNKRNSNGILVKNGRPFVVGMNTDKGQEQFATMYKETLRKAGIALNLVNMESGLILKNALEQNFSLVFANRNFTITPSFKNKLTSNSAGEKGGDNIEGLKNSRIDQLAEEYDTTSTMAARNEILRQVDSIVWATYIGVPHWFPKGYRWAYWNKFGMPEYIFNRYLRFPNQIVEITKYWWYDPAKAAALAEARKTGQTLLGEKMEVRYWDQFSGK